MGWVGDGDGGQGSNGGDDELHNGCFEMVKCFWKSRACEGAGSCFVRGGRADDEKQKRLQRARDSGLYSFVWEPRRAKTLLAETLPGSCWARTEYIVVECSKLRI
jgi:hypothetical protein